MNETITPTTTIMEQSSLVSNKLILPYYSKEVDAVHESIQNAIDLIQYYSEEQDNMALSSTTTTNQTTTTGSNSNNPDEIYHQLDMARNQISEACQTLYDVIHSKDDDDASCDNNMSKQQQQQQQQQYPLSEQEQIRIAYLNMITDSFGNVLEQYHIAAASSSNSNNNNMNDIDILADCLQSGYDMLTLLNSSSSRVWYDNDFLWNDNNEDDDDGNNDNDDDEDDDEHEQYITPHERHRQELGFQLIN